MGGRYYLGGVLARGEFLMVMRKLRSYTILEPPGEVAAASPASTRAAPGMGIPRSAGPDILCNHSARD